ncbi:hypothetical protein, partial [Larkinella rosea]|uniref:hypothetical protein n=1 Tax=Larkinella rosea TaxID=2025312 RepID=UPI001C8A6D16
GRLRRWTCFLSTVTQEMAISHQALLWPHPGFCSGAYWAARPGFFRKSPGLTFQESHWVTV